MISRERWSSLWLGICIGLVIGTIVVMRIKYKINGTNDRNITVPTTSHSI